MSFATATDIAQRLGRDLATGEAAPVALLLEGATAIIAEAAGKNDDWSDALTPVPRVLKFVCIEAVCRAMANPQGIQSLQETLGAHGTTVRFRELAAGGGLMLTQTEELLVRSAVYGTNSGSGSGRSMIDRLRDLQENRDVDEPETT